MPKIAKHGKIMPVGFALLHWARQDSCTDGAMVSKVRLCSLGNGILWQVKNSICAAQKQRAL